MDQGNGYSIKGLLRKQKEVIANWYSHIHLKRYKIKYSYEIIILRYFQHKQYIFISHITLSVDERGRQGGGGEKGGEGSKMQEL